MDLLNFFSSESGLGSRHKGLSMGWVAGVVGGAAAIVGTPEAVRASGCCGDVICTNGLRNTHVCIPGGEKLSSCDCP